MLYRLFIIYQNKLIFPHYWRRHTPIWGKVYSPLLFNNGREASIVRVSSVIIYHSSIIPSTTNLYVHEK